MPEIAAQLRETPAPGSPPSDGVVVRLSNVSVRYGRNFALRDGRVAKWRRGPSFQPAPSVLARSSIGGFGREPVLHSLTE